MRELVEAKAAETEETFLEKKHMQNDIAKISKDLNQLNDWFEEQQKDKKDQDKRAAEEEIQP